MFWCRFGKGRVCAVRTEPERKHRLLLGLAPQVRSHLLLQQTKEHGRRRQTIDAKQQVDVHDARKHCDLGGSRRETNARGQTCL